MAGLTSREGEAIKKALRLDTMINLAHKVDYLEREIKKESELTRGRALEATRILEPKKHVDGSEIRPAGNLFGNLVRGLDESGLISALTVVKDVKTELEAKRAKWVIDAHARESEEGFLPGKKFDHKTLEDLTLSS
jgi:hypothetical protein